MSHNAYKIAHAIHQLLTSGVLSVESSSVWGPGTFLWPVYPFSLILLCLSSSHQTLLPKQCLTLHTLVLVATSPWKTIPALHTVDLLARRTGRGCQRAFIEVACADSWHQRAALAMRNVRLSEEGISRAGRDLDLRAVNIAAASSLWDRHVERKRKGD